MSASSGIDSPEQWVGLGVWHLQSAISIMNLLVDNQLVDLNIIKALIDEKIKDAGSVNEEALWETYKDFLNPSINRAIPANVVRFPEGGDA